MTNPYVATDSPEARWRAWQARGAENDRQTTRRMRVLMLLIAVALVSAFVVVL